MTPGTFERPKDFGAFRDTLFQHFESLSPHLKRIAEYALGEPNRFAFQTVAQVASETRVQPSTLIRFAKAFGFSGYAELQQLFRLRLIESERSYRERTREHRDRIGRAGGDDASETLDAMADASVLAIEQLKATVDADTLTEAVRLMASANTVYLLGRDRAAPVTSCLAHGLIELRTRCVLLDSVPGMAAQQIASIDAEDLLIAVGLGSNSGLLVEAVATVHARRLPVLAVTDSMANPLARHSSACFVIPDTDIGRFAPLSAHLVLAQSLIIALGYRKALQPHGTPSPNDPARD